jgi:hypothetical protein
VRGTNVGAEMNVQRSSVGGPTFRMDNVRNTKTRYIFGVESKPHITDSSEYKRIWWYGRSQ